MPRNLHAMVDALIRRGYTEKQAWRIAKRKTKTTRRPK